MSEEWRPIPGYEGYRVSDHGRVESLHRWRGQDGPRILRTSPNVFGYPTVQLRKQGAPRNRVARCVHVLVAAAFLGPRPAGLEVRHLDGNPQNCHVGNLAYGTRAENIADQLRHGTHPSQRRAVCVNGHGGFDYVDPRTGRRYCRACTAVNSRRYRARKRARVLELIAAEARDERPAPLLTSRSARARRAS